MYVIMFIYTVIYFNEDCNNTTNEEKKEMREKYYPISYSKTSEPHKFVLNLSNILNFLNMLFFRTNLFITHGKI